MHDLGFISRLILCINFQGSIFYLFLSGLTDLRYVRIVKKKISDNPFGFGTFPNYKMSGCFSSNRLSIISKARNTKKTWNWIFHFHSWEFYWVLIATQYNWHPPRREFSAKKKENILIISLNSIYLPLSTENNAIKSPWAHEEMLYQKHMFPTME